MPLGKGQALREAGEIEAKRNHHQIGSDIQRHLHWQHAVEEQTQATDQADQRTRNYIAADAAEVVGKVQREILMAHPAHCTVCVLNTLNDTAAHADAMHAAEQDR